MNPWNISGLKAILKYFIFLRSYESQLSALQNL